jgi:hypothetical protein
MQQPSSSAWGPLEQVSNTHPEVLKIITSHMPEGSAACLRQLSRGMRRAVNSTVEEVVCQLAAKLPSSELAGTFPHADRLSVVLSADERSASPANLGDGTDAAAVSTFLGLLCATSPQFVEKIKDLEICLSAELRPDSIAA